MDIVLEGLQFDTYGKFTYASMPNDFYKQGCDTVPVASITRSETFTVTFESMTPNIAIVLRIWTMMLQLHRA